MPYLTQAALARIRELEEALAQSVPRSLFDAAEARIRALERRVDWQADMLLRRAGTYPLPPAAAVDTAHAPGAPNEQPAAAPARYVTETDIAKYEALLRAAPPGTPSEEVAAALYAETGFTLRDVERALEG